MNANNFQQFDVEQTPSDLRYARETSNRLKRHLNVVKRMRNFDSSSSRGKSIARAKRQADRNAYPYELIYMSPQTSAKPVLNTNKPVVNSNSQTLNCNSQTSIPTKPSPVYTAPKLEQIRAIYPLGAKNVSCRPKVVPPTNLISKTTPLQYVITNSAQKPQTVYLSAASLPSQTRPNQKSIPVYIRPPQVYSSTSRKIQTPPNTCNYPVITVPPPTPLPPCDPATLAVTTEHEISPITTQLPLSTTEAVPITSTTTEAHMTSTVSPIDACPNETCNGCDEHAKKCAFCINKAIIYINDKFGQKSLASLKDELKNLHDDDDVNDDVNDNEGNNDGDDCDEEESADYENSNDDCHENDKIDDDAPSSHKKPTKMGEIYIKNAVVKVNQPAVDQSKLVKLIEKLRKELNKSANHHVHSCEEDHDYPEDYPIDHPDTEPHYDDYDSKDGMTAEGTAPGTTAVAITGPDDIEPTGSDVEYEQVQQTARTRPTQNSPHDNSFRKRDTDASKNGRDRENKDGDESTCGCVKEHDLLEACKSLSATISEYQSKS